jgi:hypothetical protein
MLNRKDRRDRKEGEYNRSPRILRMARIPASANAAGGRREFPVAFVRARSVNGQAMNAGPADQTGSKAGAGGNQK